MGLRKKTINLVKKVLKNPNKVKMYSEEELWYFKNYLNMMQVERKRRIEERRITKGFDNQINYDD